MAFKRRSWKRRSRAGYGKKPRSYKTYYSRRRRRVSYRTKFTRGGILR